MNIKTLRSPVIAGLAAIAITAAGAVATPGEAKANDRAIAAFVGGLVLGGIAANAYAHGGPVYGTPVYVAPAYPAPGYYYGHRRDRHRHDRYGYHRPYSGYGY